MPKMPSLTITEEEFLNLSEPTQEELLDLFRETFSLRNEASGSVLGANWKAQYNKKENWFVRLSNARLAKASTSYQEHHDNLLTLQAELPILLKDEALRPTAISLETAIGFISGLNPDSIKVLSKLSNSRTIGSATRKELEELLNSAGKINGTVGSINRRFVKRFDKRIYGKKLDQIKLIEFDETYSLTCDAASISLAIRIIERGYKIGKGDISLQFNHWAVSDESTVQNPSYDQIIIGEEAIKLADQGLGFMRSVHWDIETANETRGFNFEVVVTAPSSTVIIETIEGINEWTNDEGEDLWQRHHHNSFPDKISFGNKTYQT